MNSPVTREQIARARKADLYQFLSSHHADKIMREGEKYIRLKAHDSIVITRGRSGYVRYSDSNETGNPIDLLQRYLNYTFIDAVKALDYLNNTAETAYICQEKQPKLQEEKVSDEHLPPRADKPFRRVFAYLTQTRGLSEKTINALIDRGLVYEDSVHHNAVFISREQVYCEIRGTLSGYKFHRTWLKCYGMPACWSFKAGSGKTEAIYICEGAIDAISLYELHCSSDRPKVPSLYCSIGGVSNQRTIDWLGNERGCRIILAVDNDPAGDSCRMRNSHMEAEIPLGKDWNEDLQSLKGGGFNRP